MTKLQKGHRHRPLPTESSDSLFSSATTEVAAGDANGRSFFKHIKLFVTGVPVAVAIILIISAISFSVALKLYIHIQQNRDGKFLQAEDIGGRYSVTVAKLIDVISSILIVPLIAAIANFYIFRLVRVCAVNEKPHWHGYVSLEALIEVSATDRGSYSPIKHWNLLRAREPRLLLVAFVAVLSALSLSLLSNVVAYQAAGFSTVESEVGLDHLYSPGRDTQWIGKQDALYFSSDQTPVKYLSYPATTTPEQDMIFKASLYSALSQLVAAPNKTLDNHKYVQVNVSDSSLNLVPGSVQHLLEIPTFRLGYKCEPSNIQDVEIKSLGNTRMAIQITAASPSNRSNNQIFVGGSEGLSPVIKGEYLAKWPMSPPLPFVAFSLSEFWLGMVRSNFGAEEASISSPFGNITKFTYNNTQYLLEEGLRDKFNYVYMKELNFYGLACSLTRESGVSNLTRISNNKVGVNDWKASAPRFDSEAVVEIDSQTPMLHDLQLSSIFSVANIPNVGDIPGLGSVLAQSAKSWIGSVFYNNMTVNFQNMVDTFLFAEGEARVTAYQLMQPTAYTNNALKYQTNAQGQGSQLYSITYVPWLLLSGLLCLFLAGILTLVLVAFSLKTRTLRTGRIVNIVRMAMDLGSAVDKDLFQSSLLMDEDSLENWAINYKVKYERTTTDTADGAKREDLENDMNESRTLIQLRHFSPNDRN